VLCAKVPVRARICKSGFRGTKAASDGPGTVAPYEPVEGADEDVFWTCEEIFLLVGSLSGGTRYFSFCSRVTEYIDPAVSFV
jgi:hypothetical protein